MIDKSFYIVMYYSEDVTELFRLADDNARFCNSLKTRSFKKFA